MGEDRYFQISYRLPIRPGYGFSSKELNDIYDRAQYDISKLIGYSASGVITPSGYPSGAITISGLYDIMDSKLSNRTEYLWELTDWMATRTRYADVQLYWNAQASGTISAARASGAPDPW
jgi:hypothetical protein